MKYINIMEIIRRGEFGGNEKKYFEVGEKERMFVCGGNGGGIVVYGGREEDFR